MCDDEHDDLRDDDVMWRMPCARFVDKDKGKCRLPYTPQGGTNSHVVLSFSCRLSVAWCVGGGMSFSFEFEGPAYTQYTSPSAFARPRRTYQSVSSMARGPRMDVDARWPLHGGRADARGLWVRFSTSLSASGSASPVPSPICRGCGPLVPTALSRTRWG